MREVCHASLLGLLLSGGFPHLCSTAGLRRSPRHALDDAPEVTLPSGARVLGRRLPAEGLPQEDDVFAYFNLRYAQAGRFEAPKLYEAPAQAILNATEVQERCIQRTDLGVVGIEDCLSLAVFIPPAPIEIGKRPVVVFIHGGFLMSGGIDGDTRKLNHLLRRSDAVLVAIQYRLHLFGFFQPPLGDTIPANRGLRDQLTALSWVQRNIASFGGNPRAVTIFGQSAGGRSVVALEQSPLSEGLFERAVALSPGFLTFMFTADVAEVERTAGQKCLNATGCSTLQCLKQLQASELTDLCSFYSSPAAFMDDPDMYFSGYDGEVLTAPVQSLYCSGADKPHRDRAMILGSVTREWNIFSPLMNPASVTDTFLQVYSDNLEQQPGGNSSRLQCARNGLLGAVEPSRCPLGVFGCIFTTATLMQAATDIYGAGVALSLGPGGGARYRFLLDTEEAGGPCSSCHGSDMNLMYGLRSPLYVGPFYPEEKLMQLSSMFMEYLASFIRTGKPEASGGPAWPPVDRTGEKDTWGTPLMIFNLSSLALATPGPLSEPSAAAQEMVSDHFCQRDHLTAC